MRYMKPDDVKTQADWDAFVEEHGFPPFARPNHRHGSPELSAEQRKLGTGRIPAKRSSA